MRSRTHPHQMAEINDAIVTEILYRLPVKSIDRFKCVSQCWFSLITHPLFFQNYLLHLKIPSSGIFLQPPSFCNYQDPEFIPINNRNSTGVPDQTLTSLLKRTNSIILHSCNGLFLLRAHINHNNYNYFICNPTTMEYVPLPTPKSKEIYGMNLVFDPSKSSTADYQVICVRRSYNSFRLQIDIYSSDTGSWKESGDAFIRPNYIIYHAGVLWNNAVNWAGMGDYSLSFDLEAEQFHITPLPQPMEESTGTRCVVYFGASQGHLHLIDCHKHRTTEFDIFEMEHDFSRWSVKYYVNLDMVKKAFPEMAMPSYYGHKGLHLQYTVLSLLRGVEEEEEVMLMINVPGKVISYCVRDGTFLKVCDLRPLHIKRTNEIYRFYELFYYAFPYMSVLHSFVSSSSSSSC